MTAGRLGLALVIDTDGKLLGIFTDGDLRRALTKNTLCMQDTVDTYMSIKPLTVSADMRLVEAEDLMRNQKIRCLIVVDAAVKPLGLVELFDV
jgi:arabinose-5-phosphate isomerase